MQRQNIILVVEDDEVSLKYIKLITEKDYNVDFTDSAEKAIEMTKQKNYNLLFLDINLKRGMDGVELMQIIREQSNYKNTPMVAVTAYASEKDRKEFLEKGFNYYLSKPYSPSELRNLLKEILG